MRKIRHAITRVEYEEAPDGLVMVTAVDGTTGQFDGNGRWVSGQLRIADPEMCRWIDSGSWPSERLRSTRRFATEPIAAEVSA